MQRTAYPFNPWIRLGLAAAILLATGLAPVALAEEPAPAPTAPSDTDDTVTVTFAGMQIAVDPETGSMRAPTAEEARQLKLAMRQMFGKRLHHAQPQVTKDGNLSVVMGLEQLNFSVLTVDAEGNPATHCTDDLASAAAILDHGPAHVHSQQPAAPTALEE